MEVYKFKGSLYQSLLKRCENKILNDFVEIVRVQIDALAENMKVPPAEVERQLRLHMPQFSGDEIRGLHSIPDQIVNIITYRMQKRNYALQSYVPETFAQLFSNDDELRDTIIPKYRKYDPDELPKLPPGFSATSNTRLAIEFKAVDKFSKSIIENNLHYLQSPRTDGLFEYGLYIQGASYPFCYASFSFCDRMYLFRAIEETLWKKNNLGQAYGRDQYLQLTRVFGMPGIPKNAISKLISLSSKRIYEKLNRYEILITAINPYLGFDGRSMLASGFLPFATAPVSYNYDVEGEYKSRRQDMNAEPANLKNPRNIVFMRARDKYALRPIKKRGPIYHVKRIDHEIIDQDNKANSYQPIGADEIRILRKTLVAAWDSETRYQRSNYDLNDPPSKGQCGVSSFYVGRDLEEKGYDVFYCEGNALFPAPYKSILHHCWLELRQVDTGSLEKTLIIDVTADQNGYETALVFEDNEILRSRGIKYVPDSKKRPKHVKVDSLWKRLTRLEEKISHIEKLEDA